VVAALSLVGVRHHRGHHEILSVDRLTVHRGERLAVLGPNGAGKTTLLRLMAAVEPPTRGSVCIDGKDTASLSARERVLVRRDIGYVAQHAALLGGSTVARNVELPLAWRQVGRPQRRELARAALDALGVAHLAGRRAHTLSGGEAQRVSLARALVTRPGILLLDEPAAALDVASRARFLDDVEVALRDRGTTLVHVSPRPEEALRLADRVAVLVDGTLRQVATPCALLRQPCGVTVARLVGYQNLLDAVVDERGDVRVGPAVVLRGWPGPAGVAVLAAWAGGLQLGAAEPGDGSFRVTEVGPGPGHWRVELRGPAALTAHVPWELLPPAVGDEVTVTVRPSAAALLPTAPAPGYAASYRSRRPISAVE
jgi:ABC-type Fe3+/spermidine/putrescine transport system ATPase subunit